MVTSDTELVTNTLLTSDAVVLPASKKGSVVVEVVDATNDSDTSIAQ